MAHLLKYLYFETSLVNGFYVTGGEAASRSFGMKHIAIFGSFVYFHFLHLYRISATRKHQKQRSFGINRSFLWAH